MRRAGLISLVVLLPAVVVLLVIGQQPMQATVASATRINIEPELSSRSIPQLPLRVHDQEPPPRLLHVHQIPAHLDPTDDAVLATTIDTRFRHLGPIEARAVSPCGNRIAAVCEAEGVIREWDACTGEEVRQFKLPKVDDPVGGGLVPEFVLPPEPLILYRDEVNQLLYCSRVGRITTFSTDDARLLVTYRSSCFDKNPFHHIILSGNGQYHLQPDEEDNCTVLDTGTGGVAGIIPKKERESFYPNLVSADGIAVFFSRENLARIIHWNSAGPNRVTTTRVPETRRNIFNPCHWIDGHRFVMPIEPLELPTVRGKNQDGVEQMPRYAVIDCQLDPPQVPVVLNNVEWIRGVQDGLLYCVDDERKPVMFDAATLKQLSKPVKPWEPHSLGAVLELTGDVRQSSLAVSSACLEHPNLDDDGSTRFQQLVMPNGSTVDLVEFGSVRNEANHMLFPQLVETPKGKFGLLGLDSFYSPYAYPGYKPLPAIELNVLKESSGIDAILGVTPAGTVWVPITNKRGDGYDCYEIAIPSGELIQKREGDQYLSLDGRWLFSTDDEKLLISSTKLGSKRNFVEDFSTLPFIKQSFRAGRCANLIRDENYSEDRNPENIYVTTDGRVFGIRSGNNDDIPRTTITVRHVDHPDWKHLTHYQLPGTGSISDQYEVSFHPNERLLFVALQHPKLIESELRCYELATLREVFRYRHPRGVSSVKFDRSGQKMLLNHKDGAQSVFDFAKFFARQLKPADAKHWLSDDPALAIPALRALAKQADAVDVVQRALKQPKPDIAADLLALGEGNFRLREAATERLRELGDDVAAELKATLDSTTDEEVRQRLHGLVRAAVPMYGLTRQQFRVLRAKEVLELADTSAAKKLVSELK